MLLIRWWHWLVFVLRWIPISLTQMIHVYVLLFAEWHRSQSHFSGGWGNIYCKIFHYHTTKCVCTTTILRKGERNEMQKMAFNNFTGHCQLNTDMVILHWTMIIQPEAISQNEKNYASWNRGRVLTFRKLKNLSS